MTVEEVYRITKTVEKKSKRNYNDLLESFKDMSSGGKGGPYFVGHRLTTVRQYHYSKWSDDDFINLLKMLGIENE